MRLLRSAVPLACLLSACVGSFDDASPYRPGDENRVRCDEPGPAANPIRRLTPEQYRASLGAIFPGVDLPRVEVVGNSLDNAYENDVRGQGVSALLVEQLGTGAGDVATAAMTDRSWMPCDLAEGTACAHQIADQVGARAYRRPLTDEERNDFQALIDAVEPDLGVEEAVSVLIEAVLQSPTFLYLPEIGDESIEAPDGMIALTDVEMANRLSFVLWNRPPDDALMAAAEAGRLTNGEQLAGEVDRMLADSRTAEAMDSFFAQWMRLDRLQSASVDQDLYPELSEPGMRDDLAESALAFTRHAFWEEGTTEALFTSRTGFVNDRLAPLFGVPAPGSDELVPVELPAAERAGLMTQPGLLASTSHGLRHSPILRGVFVLDRVLCDPPDPPPPDLIIDLSEETPGGDPVTTREKIEGTHGTAECASCHDSIDAMGFTFENYDAIGRYRTEEYGQSVDPSSVFRNEPVANAVDMTERLPGDRGANTCVTTHLYRYALARPEQDGDACQIRQLTDELHETGDLRGLIRSLLLSNAFRFRPEEDQ